MKEAIRCCVSCILPCGALDVVRIVHTSGRVEEISGTVSAGDIMQAYPKHVLKKPPSTSLDSGSAGAGDIPKAVILPPNAELKRGKIYFLMPAPSLPAEKQHRAAPGTTTATKTTSTEAAAATTMRRSKSRGRRKRRVEAAGADVDVDTDKTRLLLNERYLSEILSEKVSSQRDRRRGRVGVWRPHLESIYESSSDH